MSVLGPMYRCCTMYRSSSMPCVFDNTWDAQLYTGSAMSLASPPYTTHSVSPFHGQHISVGTKNLSTLPFLRSVFPMEATGSQPQFFLFGTWCMAIDGISACCVAWQFTLRLPSLRKGRKGRRFEVTWPCDCFLSSMGLMLICRRYFMFGV